MSIRADIERSAESWKRHGGAGSGLVVVEARKAGTWTLTVERDGVVVHRTTGIGSVEEGRRRAAVWRDLCGYRVCVAR